MPLLFIIASGQKKKKESKETFGPVSAGFTVDESVASVWKFPQNFDYDSDGRVIVASTRGQHQCSKVPIPELEVILKSSFPLFSVGRRMFEDASCEILIESAGMKIKLVVLV